MYQEIERQVAQRTGAGDEIEVDEEPDPPLSQNRNPDYNPPSSQIEISNWEMSQDRGQQVLN